MCIENKELKKFIFKAFAARDNFPIEHESMKEPRVKQHIFIRGLIRGYRISCKELNRN